MIMDRILKGWHAMRVLQAVIAVVFLFAAITRNEPVAWFAAIFFGVQALFNVGCCGMGSCSTSATRVTTPLPSEPIVYEEIR